MEDRLRRRYEREKNARLEAERILEDKSKELFDRNQELKALSESLEKQVDERTKALELARDEALAATRAKSVFMANMSHEIRTPLNGVLGMITMLSETDLNDRQQNLMNTAKESGQHLLEIVNDILDFSKIEAGQMQLYPEPTNLPALLQHTCELLRPVTRNKGIGFNSEIAPDFPESINVDALRVRQIATNLISNAIKFTDKGQVTVSLRHSNDQCILDVQDTGIGMSPEQCHRIFNAFDQADESITRKFGGTGLGLTITQDFCKMMGGHISVSSKEQEGSLFTVTLPLTITNEAKEVVPIEFSDSSEFKQQAVLLVEDNAINTEIAKYLLEKAILKVTTANHGQEAIDALSHQSFQLVLMDIQMPVMDGLTATQTLRAMGYSAEQLPIIAMTAHATEEHRQLSLNSGMNDHITKPLEPVTLYNTLANYLATQESTEQESTVEKSTLVDNRLEIFNEQQATLRLGGNVELLKRIGRAFCDNHQNCVDEFKNLISQGNRQDAQRLAHTLKGSAANISANAFSQAASQLEQALKQNAEATKIDTLTVTFTHEAERLFPVLATFAQEQDAAPQAEQEPQHWTTLLTTLKNCLHEDHAQAEYELTKLRQSAIPEGHRDTIEQMNQALEIFDIPTADQLLNALIEEVNRDR